VNFMQVRKVISCPFHEEKTPSCMVFQNDTYRCFGCGRKGSQKQLLAQLRRLVTRLRAKIEAV
jgi:DNA primase